MKRLIGGGAPGPAGSGTAGAPGIAFASDPNTGIFNPAADTLAFAEGGVEAMRIDSSGRVGIGTSAPQTTIQAVGAIESRSANTYRAIRLEAQDTQFQVLKAHNYLGAPYNSQLQFQTMDGTSVTTAMTIDPLGRLLVGTTSATANGGVLQISNGITFPGTQSACSDPNTLDDYEEGTWTPTDASGGGLTFAAASGKYTKVGRLITLAANITFPTTADGNGVKIGGLPFNNITGTQGCGFSAYVDGTAPGLVFRSQDSSGNIFATSIADQDNQPTNATFSGRSLQFTYIYQV